MENKKDPPEYEQFLLEHNCAENHEQLSEFVAGLVNISGIAYQNNLKFSELFPHNLICHLKLLNFNSFINIGLFFNNICHIFSKFRVCYIKLQFGASTFNTLRYMSILRTFKS